MMPRKTLVATAGNVKFPRLGYADAVASDCGIITSEIAASSTKRADIRSI